MRKLIAIGLLLLSTNCYAAIKLQSGGVDQGYINVLDCEGSATCTASGITGTVTASGGGITGLSADSGGTTTGSTVTIAGDTTSTSTTRSSNTITVAVKSSAALTGSPTTTTQSQGDNSTKVATTAYVDTAVLGQNYKEACKYASTAALPSIVYANGSSGVGATLTGVALAAISLDSSSPSVNDRVLIKNQVSTFQNGIYTVTATGSGIAVFILTRATDANQSAEFKTGDAVFVTSGSTLSNTTWSYTGADSPTIGTDAIIYSQSASAGGIIGGKVTGGTANRVLYEDASGNLKDSPNFTFTDATSVFGFTGTTTMTAGTGTVTPQRVIGASGQTSNLGQWETSTGTLTTSIGPTGTITSYLNGTRNVQRRFIVFPVTTSITPPSTTVGQNCAGSFSYQVDSYLNAFKVTTITATVTTATSTGSGLLTMNLRNRTQGTNILSTALTIDNTERSSTTAATPAVINASNASISTDDDICIQVSNAGSGASGLQVSVGIDP